MKQTALQDTVYKGGAGGLDRHGTPHGPFRRVLRRVIHFFSYHLILARRSTRVVRAAGFHLTVRPTVFHPRYFISSECFAEFIDNLDLRGTQVIDVGTGSGILALELVFSKVAGPQAEREPLPRGMLRISRPCGTQDT